MNSQKQAGFTLVELLVVLSILAILTALLLPVFLQGKQRAHEAVCVSNLRQVNLALSLYVMDNEGSYPPAVTGQFDYSHNHSSRNWFTLIQTYLRTSSALRCPDVQTPGGLAAYSQNSGTWGYAYNARLDEVIGNRQHETFRGNSEAAVAYPAVTITVYDARAGIDAGRGPDLGQTFDKLYGIFRVDFMADILAQPEGARRHHGGANYVFVDGHATWLQPTQVRKDKRSDGIHPGFGL